MDITMIGLRAHRKFFVSHATFPNNYVPVDFIVLDIDCNPSCPIIFGRPFLRTIGAIIDTKEGNIRFQFPLKKGMEHFPRKKIRLPYESMMRANDVSYATAQKTFRWRQKWARWQHEESFCVGVPSKRRGWCSTAEVSISLSLRTKVSIRRGSISRSCTNTKTYTQRYEGVVNPI